MLTGLEAYNEKLAEEKRQETKAIWEKFFTDHNLTLEKFQEEVDLYFRDCYKCKVSILESPRYGIISIMRKQYKDFPF